MRSPSRSYALTLDPSSGLPPLLHPSNHATLPLTLPPSKYPVIASPGDINSPVDPGIPGSPGPDGVPDLYTVDAQGQLIEYPYVQNRTDIWPPQYHFAPPQILGAVTNTSNHAWDLSDGAGSTAADTSGGLNATLSGAYNWTTDSGRGNVINFTGTTGYAATQSLAVDTSQGCTVSAWVKLTSSAANSTFVSQSDSAGNTNGLQLYYSSGAQAWAFGRHNDDTTSTSYTSVYGTHAVTGQWTHLVGVFDADAEQLSIYVNGHLAGTKTYSGTMWKAAGPLQIGRRLYQGAYGEYANAQISDVRTYPTALPPADAAARGDNPVAVQLD